MAYMPRYTLQLVRSGTVSYHKTIVRSADQAKRVVSEVCSGLLADCPNEKFGIVALDTQLRPISVFIITEGILDASLVHPREVFQRAFLSNASAIILFHNHPSGDCTPSREDRSLTERLQKCGDLLGIRVLDHIVFGIDAITGETNAVSILETSI